MTTTPPLTRDIGRTERTLQALIHQQLARAEVAFPEWVALTLLSGSGPLTARDLARRLVDDEIVSADDARVVVEAMVETGWVGPAVAGPVDLAVMPLTITDAGAAVHAPLRATIGQLTGALFADMDASDLDATRRTLEEVTRRARRLLV